MMSISKEQLEQSFNNKSIVELEDLVRLIEENFGYTVTLKKKENGNISDEQKKLPMKRLDYLSFHTVSSVISSSTLPLFVP